MPKTRQKKEKNFVIWGFIILIVLFSGLYILKKKGEYSLEKDQSLTPTLTSSPKVVEDFSKVTKIISDGQAADFTTSWTPFELNIPLGWKLIHQAKGVPAVLTKGDYQLTIAYPYEGSICNFPDTKTMDGPAGDFQIESEFTTAFGFVRLGKSKPVPGSSWQTYSMCQKEKTSEYWTVILPVGVIWYQTPINPDKKIISEMNTIVKSITLTN